MAFICRHCRAVSRTLSSRTYTTTTARTRPPPRCAIIGSGPAGFYAAHRMLQKLPGIKIDMYEALPTPFGLVRYGVAPDHPEVKNCIQTFNHVASKNKDSFTFIGDVTLGPCNGQLPLSALQPHYDAIFFAYGATKDRRLGVPGEDLHGIHSARAFVGWYNGLPEYADLKPELDNAERVVVIGQGNVALDVARILLSPVDRLRHTDISDSALELLSKSRVKHVSIVGRRGPLQAPYTTKEVRELTSIPGVTYEPARDDDPFMKQADKLPRQLKRLAQVLSKQPDQDERVTASRHWQMRYMLNPMRFEPATTTANAVGAVNFDIMKYASDSSQLSLSDMDAIRSMRVNKNQEGHTECIEADMVFRSIGYQAEAIPGLDAIGVPFDSTLGIMPNDVHGRVLAPNRGPGGLTAGHVPGMYCAGWVKRGPTGVIATTMDDAFASADVMIRDWTDGVPFINNGFSCDGNDTSSGWDGVKEEASRRGIRSVSWADWQVIDAEERRRGQASGKERVKCRTVAEMLQILDR